MFRFAIPSKGGGFDGTIQLFESCGMRLVRSSPKKYTAQLRGMPETEILLHRPEDIIDKVAEGNIALGITGLDVLFEERDDDENILMLYEDLGFWGVNLVLAAPQSWVDVNSWQDLADLAVEFQSQGRALRIATKYPNLVRRFCYSQGINVFQLVSSAGATEAAPGLGYADIIADITETGNALRENHLKIVGGTILRSQACMIGSKRLLQANPHYVEQIRTLLELIEARQQGRTCYSLVANIAGESVAAVGQQITALPQLAGLQGPTIAPVYNKHATDALNTNTDTSNPIIPSSDSDNFQWYAINVIVQQRDLLPVVDYLRGIGASTVTFTPVQYAFHAQCKAYQALLDMLN
jgi:ATP phosphoribosyltransferase